MRRFKTPEYRVLKLEESTRLTDLDTKSAPKLSSVRWYHGHNHDHRR